MALPYERRPGAPLWGGGRGQVPAISATAPVVVLGSLNCDLVVAVDRLPLLGETRLGGNGRLSMGGKGYNQAVAARRQGAGVAMIGCVGDDTLGTMATAALAHEGIDAAHIHTLAGAGGGCAAIMVTGDGDNCIAVAPGANAGLTAVHVDAAQALIAGAALLLASLETPVDAVRAGLAQARRHGVRTLLNPAPASADAASLLPLSDIVTPNLGELAALCGQAPNAQGAPDALDHGLTGDATDDALIAAMTLLTTRGAGCVVTTLGAGGAVLWDGSRFARFAASRGTVIDTVGAGDVFSGVLAAALADGLVIDDAIRRAQAAAGLSVRRASADCAPTRAQTDAALASPPARIARDAA